MPSPWMHNEQGYLDMLQRERRRYAWDLRRCADYPPELAERAAEEFYAYEPADYPCRGLVFHDEAWHWALRRHFGVHYDRRPDLLLAYDDYRVLE